MLYSPEVWANWVNICMYSCCTYTIEAIGISMMEWYRWGERGGRNAEDYEYME